MNADEILDAAVQRNTDHKIRTFEYELRRAVENCILPYISSPLDGMSKETESKIKEIVEENKERIATNSRSEAERRFAMFLMGKEKDIGQYLD